MSQEKTDKNLKETIATIFVIACIIAVIIGLFCFHYNTIRNSWELTVVEARGLETEALVLKSSHSPASGKSLESFTLDYQYSIDGKTFSKCKYVDRTYTVGGSVTIKYLQENPKVSDIPGNTGLLNHWIQMVVLDIILFIALIWGIILYRREKWKEKAPLVQDTGILDDIDIKNHD